MHMNEAAFNASDAALIIFMQLWNHIKIFPRYLNF